MIGAIAGDIIGSAYEFGPGAPQGFPLFSPRSRFTDDTVMTIAVADTILCQGQYPDKLHAWGNRYPSAGYGGKFYMWLFEDDQRPYHSFGNGSAMRVSAVGFAFNTEKEVLEQAQSSAECTHNHPEGIKGAQATALAIWLGRQGATKAAIRQEITQRFGYNLKRTLQDIRRDHTMDETCQGTVPVSLIGFLGSKDYEDAIRRVVSLGGDTDTLAAITGGIAQAFYKKIPEHIIKEVRDRLTPDIKDVLDAFDSRFGCEY
jgi:ADP-ribosylglycohydrolase